jgi:hypothetical protein
MSASRAGSTEQSRATPLPVQILLNNLLYVLSETPIPMDAVDPESMTRPRHWNIRFIRNFMRVLGPVSSLFDFPTFGLLLFVFAAGQALFQTGWFIESRHLRRPTILFQSASIHPRNKTLSNSGHLLDLDQGASTERSLSELHAARQTFDTISLSSVLRPEAWNRSAIP